MARVDTFAARLRNALDIRDMSQSELANMTGISKSSISRYLKGDWKGKQDAVYALAIALNVAEAWLMGYDVEMERDQTGKNNFDVFSIPGILPIPKMKKVPRLGTIACGTPILAEQNIETFDDISENIQCDFALQCKGDSMTGARIMNGDIVFIRQQPEVENGEIAAVLIGDEATLKRVYKHDHSLVLQAENPAYPPMVYSGNQLEEVRILGKAVWFKSMVR